MGEHLGDSGGAGEAEHDASLASEALSTLMLDRRLLKGFCVACLAKEALFVMDECGHLVYCRACRRHAVARALADRGEGGNRRELCSKKLQRTAVLCPICRSSSTFIELDK